MEPYLAEIRLFSFQIITDLDICQANLHYREGLQLFNRP